MLENSEQNIIKSRKSAPLVKVNSTQGRIQGVAGGHSPPPDRFREGRSPPPKFGIFVPIFRIAFQ